MKAMISFCGSYPFNRLDPSDRNRFRGVRSSIRTRHFSRQTEKCYLYWASMGAWVASERSVAASTQNGIRGVHRANAHSLKTALVQEERCFLFALQYDVEPVGDCIGRRAG